MGIGVSVFLIAVGAILAFAVNVTAQGINLATVGWILMAVGTIGLIVALIVMGGFGGTGGTTVIDDELAPPPRHVVRRRSYVD